MSEAVVPGSTLKVASDVDAINFWSFAFICKASSKLHVGSCCVRQKSSSLSNDLPRVTQFIALLRKLAF